MRKSIFTIFVLLLHCYAWSGSYRNPVIKGFHPDPSICRAGDDYYLVNSSFEYFPGVPLFHSKDLVNWEQIGHVLTRPSQLQIKGGNVWGGIYAPTIRYHDGVFYMITTHTGNRGNFLVYTDNPRGKWSDPVWIEQGGIDPSLYFENGKCYLVSNPNDAIWMSEINPKTGKLLTKPRVIWRGTGGRYPEGPHLYKKDGWYYLMISEGGTEFGHKVTIARSRNIEGPYESNPNNPILTHINQNAQTNPIQGVGHADLVEAHDGSWWMVHLGFRIQDGQHHVLGRETFLAPVEWNKDGWPVVNGNGTVSERMENVKTLPLQPHRYKVRTDFEKNEWGLEWNWIGNPDTTKYDLTARKGFLRLHAASLKLDSMGSPTFVGRRQEDIRFQATTAVQPHGEVAAGITAYMAPGAHYDLYVAHSTLHLRYRIGDLCHDRTTDIRVDSTAYLRIEGSNTHYIFSYSSDGKDYKEIDRMNVKYLSSETYGGFTGVYLGLFAEGKSSADFGWFTYRSLEDPESPKLSNLQNNPLIDFMFTADPTAVEHNGRLYVYATNDQEQYEAVGKDGRNTYEHIKSLVMLSTADMVNWTYHGTIKTGKIAPWIITPWAPSVIKQTDKKGKTHFYLYFSNSGFGTGVLTADSPVGPWRSPLDKSLVDANTEGLGDCKVPFDPGAVIDDKGTGWLTFGAGKARIVKLGKDFISIDSPITEIKAPHHFEANELNFMKGTFVYTYNIDWQPLNDWKASTTKPTICSMNYMTSKTPLITDSWVYQANYFKNPGDYGFDFSNNHTHLHPFKGKWYLFYHNMDLQQYYLTDGGFRNVCVDEIKVDEEHSRIEMGTQTLNGVEQIQPVNPYVWQEAEMTAGTQNVIFTEGKAAGNMLAGTSNGNTAKWIVKGVDFEKGAKECFLEAQGNGSIEIRKNHPSRECIAMLTISSTKQKRFKATLSQTIKGKTNLYFILKGNAQIDRWMFR